jgi:hypothetical protein
MRKTTCPHSDDVILTKQSVHMINNKMTSIELKLDKFIDSVRGEFATKEEMRNAQEELIWQRRTIIFGSIIFIIAIISNMIIMAWPSQ